MKTEDNPYTTTAMRLEEEAARAAEPAPDRAERPARRGRAVRRKVVLSLPEELHSWAKAEAERRYSSLTGVVCLALKEAKRQREDEDRERERLATGRVPDLTVEEVRRQVNGWARNPLG